SKYSRSPSQHTPSKSSARMSVTVTAGHPPDADRVTSLAWSFRNRLTFQSSTAGVPLAPLEGAMGSFGRKISMPPATTRASAPSLDERLANLESEADRLRAELANLQDDIRWLAGDDDEEDGDPSFLSRGLLARGWVRASFLLAVAGLVGLVSVPYLFHVLDPSSGHTADPISAPTVQSVAPVAP